MATIETAEHSHDPRDHVATLPVAPLVAPRRDVVRIFSIEPDFLAGIDDQTARLLTDRVVAPRLWVESGPWEPPATERVRRSLGLLVIDGLLLRTVELHGRRCPEVVGAGDLLRPWDDLAASLPHDASWTALGRASVALLDESFASVVARWPSIVAQLLTRGVQRSRSLALHLAIVHVRHADVRLRMLLWHLADRWGRMTPDGVHLPLRLTHELLAELACLRRPTASSALKRLARKGEIVRRADGTWLLTGAPPDPL